MFINTTCFSQNSFSISCRVQDATREDDSQYIDMSTLATSIIIAILSPVAVAGNALILAAICKKTFQRTPFHDLLSGLAITDLCTGLVVQPYPSSLYPPIFIQ